MPGPPATRSGASEVVLMPSILRITGCRGFDIITFIRYQNAMSTNHISSGPCKDWNQRTWGYLPGARMRSRIQILALILVFSTACAVADPVIPRIVTVDHGARDPQISPDGSSIAVSILGKVWLLPSGGGEARQISYG